MARKSKRVVVINDLHCGHVAGLTPPMWQMREKEDKSRTKWNKFAKLQRTLWDEYEKILDSLGKIDILAVVGDCIDGKGQKSGGTELITSDRDEQANMAIYVIKRTKAKKVIMVYGTAFHTGTDEDFENEIADGVNAEKIGAHEWFDVNGLIFDIKHQIGSSAVPHGRHTAMAKDRLWNLIWAEHEMQPKADVLLRGHVHYFDYCGSSDWLGMTLPALQSMGTKFGSRIMSGYVDWGLVYFDVKSKDDWQWDWAIRKIKPQQTTAIKL